MSGAEIATDPLLSEQWYYSFEVEPGVWTRGHEHPNLILTRELLAGVELEPQSRALDIGTQEAAIPVLLRRRDLGDVVAYDRILRRERIEFLQRALGSEFELLGGIAIRELAGTLAERGHRPFDLVVFSGVLYHMIDPFGGIASVRGLVRDGGLVLVETTTAFTDDVAIHLSLGRFGPHTISAPSVRALDAMLRAVGLEPLDAVRFKVPRARRSELPLTRCAVVCRARPDRELPPGIARPDLEEYIDWESLRSDSEPLAYRPTSGRSPLPDRDEALAAVLDADPIPIDDRVRIALGDRR